jgi:peptide-methionine (S)-S-oxide reductase
VEAVFEPLEGVKEVVSGYAGGSADDATYDRVSSGRTAHAEAVRVTYDPKVVSYATLLHVLFSTHDPTTKDRQGPDHGPQYRSAIFFAGPEERAVAEAYVKQLDAARAFRAPVVTTFEPLTAFHPAEAYHQDFVARHPDHPYVRQWVPAKLAKLRDGFREALKPAHRR